MKRITVLLPDELEAAVAEFQRRQPVPPTTSAITVVAMREYLTRQNVLPPQRPWRITPIDAETAAPTDSQEHDRLISEHEDIWANYDPGRVLAGINAAAGAITPEESDRLKDAVYRGREEGTRPIDRP